uniref:C-X-C motif chemokine n=1 Tax=Strigops habroptila TaxID=2489341 RepID=A0A672V194_STRHB
MCPHPVIWSLSLLLVDTALKVLNLLFQISELRCHCIQTATGLILPKHLANVEIIPKGPHCNAVEIIGTLKNSKQICLDPQAKWVKMIINGILQSTLTKALPCTAQLETPAQG